MSKQTKNLKRVHCKNKEQVLAELGKFINKDCDKGGVHIFHKVELKCGCSKCGNTFTIDENIMKTVDIDWLINGKKT